MTERVQASDTCAHVASQDASTSEPANPAASQGQSLINAPPTCTVPKDLTTSKPLIPEASQDILTSKPLTPALPQKTSESINELPTSAAPQLGKSSTE